MHSQSLKFELGDLITIKHPKGEKKVSLVATGSMLQMGDRLCKHFPDLGLISAPSLKKPINKKQVIELCSNHAALITLEEHSILGGLGSILSEIAVTLSNINIYEIGIQDKFQKNVAPMNIY